MRTHDEQEQTAPDIQIMYRADRSLTAGEPILEGVVSDCHKAEVKLCSVQIDPFCTSCGQFCTPVKPDPDENYDLWKKANLNIPISQIHS